MLRFKWGRPWRSAGLALPEWIAAAPVAVVPENRVGPMLGGVSARHGASWHDERRRRDRRLDAQFAVDERWPLNPILLASPEQAWSQRKVADGMVGLQTRRWFGAAYAGLHMFSRVRGLVRDGTVLPVVCLSEVFRQAVASRIVRSALLARQLESWNKTVLPAASGTCRSSVSVALVAVTGDAEIVLITAAIARPLTTSSRRGLRQRKDAQASSAWEHGGGFSVAASVRVEAVDRLGLKHLLRYCARPVFALERLCEIGPEHLVYERVKRGPRPRDRRKRRLPRPRIWRPEHAAVGHGRCRAAQARPAS